MRVPLNRRRIRDATVAFGVVIFLFVSLEYSSANAESRWSAGDSQDRMRGDAGYEARPPAYPRLRTKPTRCTSSKCRQKSKSPRSQDASKENKELVLPRPTILVEPESRILLGTTVFLRVEAPAFFGDYVRAGDSMAEVRARPLRAECQVAGAHLGGSLSEHPRFGWASTPPMPLFVDNFEPLHIVCRLLWDAHWQSNDGSGGPIPDRETSNDRYYPVGAAVSVLVG